MIPYGKQDISQKDIDAVVEVLKSDLITQGPMVPKFEKTVSLHVGAKHGVAVNSATSALHIACLALGLGKGDRLWTSPITFVASANCGLYCGAEVDFVDIDLKTYNLCPQALKLKLEAAKKIDRLPKVVIAVHLCGQSCDMASIYALSEEYGFRIIEDASHAIGGRYKNEFIGNCLYSDITVFSFHPVKIVTTAEGGMAVTNNDKLAERMVLLRSHGVTRDPKLMTQEIDGPWFYQQIALGYNYRMTEIQAALGVSQMQRLDSFVSQRHELAKQYNVLLADLPVTIPWLSSSSYSAFHLYVIRLKLENIEKTHLEIFELLRAKGVGVNLHYIPVYLHPFYQKNAFNKQDYSNAEEYYSTALSLPLFSSMSVEQLTFCVNQIKSIIN